MNSFSVVIFFVFVLSSAATAQERKDTVYLEGSDTMLIREYGKGKLEVETFELHGLAVKTRYYFYSDTSFFYTEWTKKHVDYVLHEFYLDSTPSSIRSYHKDKLNGPCRFFYPNGNLEYVMEFSMDKQVGLEYHYTEDGKLCCITKYVNGVEKDTWYPGGNWEEDDCAENGNLQWNLSGKSRPD